MSRARSLPKIQAIDESVGQDRLLNQREVSWLLGINKTTLEYWRSRSNKGPEFIKCGRLVRYSLKALRRYIRHRTVKCK